MSLSSCFAQLSPASSEDAGLIPYSLSEIVDIRRDAVDLACRLSCLSRFLRAARKLLTCQYLTPDEFHRHSRKIIRLVEIAHRTLAGANLLPFSLHSCYSPFQPQKSAYRDLLRMLHDHRHHVDTALQDRLAQLLPSLAACLPRSKGVAESAVIPGRPDAASSEDRPGRLATASIQRPQKCPHYKPATNPEGDPRIMPPPDNFSEPCTNYQRTAQISRRTHQQLWDPELFTSTATRRSRRRVLHTEDNNQENNPAIVELEPPQRLLRPLPRRFGIFCTGKITMHRETEQVSRRTGTSYVIKE